jgi:parallel beta-helix repeat protein
VALLALSGGVALQSKTVSAIEPGLGLTAEYFDGINFDGPSKRVLTPRIAFNWRSRGPVPGISSDTFSARYSGDIAAPTSGSYTFYATADDGVRLSVNGKSVLSDWSDHARRESRGSVDLVAGQRVPILLEYFEHFGLASLRFEWSGPGIARQVVPAASLFPTNESIAPITVVSPPTTLPQTSAPQTTAPPTTMPPTTSPEISIPQTTVPPTTSPETSVPLTTVPLTTLPLTTLQSTTASAPNTTPPTPTVTPTTTAIAPTSTTPTPPLNTFFVSPTGDDANPGTKGEPWQTIQKAAAALSAGQTALVADGTYSNGIYFNNRNGAPGQPITIKAAPGAKPIVNISKLQDNGVAILGSTYITIEGLDFVYTGPSAANDKGERFESGIDIFADEQLRVPHHINIIGNRVHGFPGGGISTVQTDYITIENNVVWENAFWSKYQNSGISLYQSVDVDLKAGPHNIIRGNLVFKNENKTPDPAFNAITDGNCIIIDDGRRRQEKIAYRVNYPSYESDTLVENNICAGNGGSGIRVFNSDNVLVRNNTVYKNLRTPNMRSGELAATFYKDTSDARPIATQAPKRRGNVRFVNNLVVTDGKVATFFATNEQDPNVGDDRASASFERTFRFGGTFASGDDVITSTTPGDIEGNFMPFVSPSMDALAADFRLLPNSWAIDSASVSEASPNDYTGLPRDRAPDIGAWEFR